MNHIDEFKESKRQIKAIVNFIALIAFLSLFQPASEFGWIIKLVKFIGILTTLHFLLQGKKWATNVIIAISAFSIIQGIIPFILTIRNYNGIVWPIFYLILIGSFCFIIWYLTSSKKFENYAKLMEQGFSNEITTSKGFGELVDTKLVFNFSHKEIRETTEYLNLLNKLFNLANINNLIERVSISEENKNHIEIETNDSIFEVEINKDLNVFDRNFIYRLNNVLDSINQESQFYFVHPESILNRNFESLSLAFIEEQNFNELVELGYAEKIKS